MLAQLQAYATCKSLGCSAQVHIHPCDEEKSWITPLPIASIGIMQIEWARESASYKALVKDVELKSLLVHVGNLHCMSSMLLAKEATAQSQEGTIILDVVKIDLVG